MKVSELINKLQELKELHGDLEVGKFNDDYGYIDDFGCVELMTDEEENEYIVLI